MEKFYFSRFTFSVRCKTTILLPSYNGSTLRGGFGHAFRRIICAAAPHPFILEPSTNSRKSYQEGEDFSFGLTLLGRAADYLPYFIYAFEELGRIGIGKGRGKYELREVAEEGGESKGNVLQKKRVIYSGDTKLLTQTYPPIQWSDIVINHPSPPSAISISFITPTRIKYKNSLTKDLEFHVFFRNLLRRISLLSYFHCNHRIDDTGFKDLIEQAGKIKTIKRAFYWHDWERYSNRQETRMKMGGFMGEITYEGELGEFWPYIKLGEYVHVGKGSGFGLGRYRIKE